MELIAILAGRSKIPTHAFNLFLRWQSITSNRSKQILISPLVYNYVFIILWLSCAARKSFFFFYFDVIVNYVFTLFPHGTILDETTTTHFITHVLKSTLIINTNLIMAPTWAIHSHI